jgi:hypothetical protein
VTGMAGHARPSVAPSHMRVGLGCASGLLTKLTSLALYETFDGTIPTDGTFDGTIPTEM